MTATPRTRTPAFVASEDAEASPATAFRRRAQDGEIYLLPGCGLVAKLRRPGLIGLIQAGSTTNPLLSPDLLRMMAQQSTTAPKGEAEQLRDFERNAKAYQEVAIRCFVEPRMVADRAPDYDHGEIGPADITDFDYVWLYWSFSQGDDQKLAPFRVAGNVSRA